MRGIDVGLELCSNKFYINETPLEVLEGLESKIGAIEFLGERVGSFRLHFLELGGIGFRLLDVVYSNQNHPLLGHPVNII